MPTRTSSMKNLFSRKRESAAAPPIPAPPNGVTRVRLVNRKHVAGRPGEKGSEKIGGEDESLAKRGVEQDTRLDAGLSRRSSCLSASSGEEVCLEQEGAADPRSPDFDPEAHALFVAKRIRDQVLGRRKWALLDGSAGAGPDPTEEGSLDYLVSAAELIALCKNAVANRFWCEASLVEVSAPAKVFGDLHGQFDDLLRFFDEYGAPEPYGGDVAYVSYVFLGDYVDRGMRQLECVALLLALKTCHPEQVTLLRGNHEDEAMNEKFGFLDECVRRIGERSGDRVWAACNEAFTMLPLSAVIDGAILCMHGGIGSEVTSLKQLRELPRPLRIDPEARDEATNVAYDTLWSDPTEHDGALGVRANPRGEGVVRFGPDRVRAFCTANGLQLLLRAHECVMDGFEYFAQGQLLTVFSCPDYGGKYDNDGAMLVISRGLEVLPKVICSRFRSAAPPDAETDAEAPPAPARTPPAAQLAQSAGAAEAGAGAAEARGGDEGAFAQLIEADELRLENARLIERVRELEAQVGLHALAVGQPGADEGTADEPASSRAKRPLHADGADLAAKWSHDPARPPTPPRIRFSEAGQAGTKSSAC